MVGLLALLTRSLRQDARQLRNHIFRLVFVGFIYLSLIWAMLFASTLGAPGLSFFWMIAWLNAVFISCAGIGFFASSITEEKEEGTIGLLLMAGLNPLSILMGKSTSRLIQAAMLLIVQFPFMLLAVTLGGVTPYQVFAAYIALLSFMVLLANVALIGSTICERTGSAAGLTFIWLVLYGFSPILSPAFQIVISSIGLTRSSRLGGLLHDLLEWSSDISVYWRLSRIMETGFNDPIMSDQVVSNVTGGLLCFLFACLVFPMFTKDSNVGAVSRGLVRKSGTRINIFNAGRSWSHPLAWKDFTFMAGGFTFVTLKLATYVLLAAGLVYYHNGLIQIGLMPPTLDVNQAYGVCVGIVIMIEACLLSARIFYDEVRLQTLSTLLILPRSIPYIGYTKLIGCLLGLLPSVLCLFVGLIILPGTTTNLAFDLVMTPHLWGGVLVLAIFTHLVTLLSLFVKWGALPLAIVILVPTLPCCPITSLLLMTLGPVGSSLPRDPGADLAAIVTIWILTGMFCFVFQMMIASRLMELGTK